MLRRVFAILLLVLAVAPAVHAAAASDSTVVILLGTGMPRPDPDASGPATAIAVGSRTFLFDAGPGVVRRFTGAQLPLRSLSALFVTHLHSDHTLGYPDVVLTSWVMGRRGPLAVYGPPGLQAMTDHVLAAWAEDIDVRVHGLEHESEAGLAIAVHEIRTAGVVYDSSGVRITAIPVLHGSWQWAYGYRIDTADRSVVISGDTRYCPALVSAARGVDILIHETYSAATLRPESRPGGEDWPEYMRQFHTSDVELGRLAAEAQPKLLVVHHIVRAGATDEQILAGIRAGGFTGRTVIGHDLERY